MGRGDAAAKQITVGMKFLAMDIARIKWGRDDMRPHPRGV